MTPAAGSSGKVQDHYERHPYPVFPLLATVRRSDTYALNLRTLWARFNGTPLREGDILLAGCGSFSPYPFAIANEHSRITALDLSDANLRRARLHCLLHRCTNVSFVRGDLLDQAAAPGKYHFIDSFGVLHHLDNPERGLSALAARLEEGGIIRLMVYGRQARREEQAIRTALRMLRITDVGTAQKLLRRAPPGSRLREFIDASSEAATPSGLADALLHPVARTFTIDELMTLVERTPLRPLLFAHAGALPDIEAEVERIRNLEVQRKAGMNFILYLGLHPSGAAPLAPGTELFLNPTLHREVRPLRLRPLQVPDRLGRENPVLDRRTRRFLRTFSGGRRWESLDENERRIVPGLVEALFLGAIVPDGL